MEKMKCAIVCLSLAFVLICTQTVSVRAAGSKEPCPPPASQNIIEACTYDVRQFGHFRDCTVDIFISLCALLYPTSADWPFICTNPNYNLGCRYGYNNCVNTSSINAQAFYLSWYDGIVLGGKYSVCDMGSDTLTTNLNFNQCYLNNTIKLQQCSIDFMQLFQTNLEFTCSDMNTKVSCFLDALQPCSDKTAFNIFQQYFRGVVSLTQCNGKIAGVGGAITTVANTLLIAICLSIYAIFNKQI